MAGIFRRAERRSGVRFCISIRWSEEHNNEAGLSYLLGQVAREFPVFADQIERSVEGIKTSSNGTAFDDV